jgi:hypothetical protein
MAGPPQRLTRLPVTLAYTEWTTNTTISTIFTAETRFGTRPRPMTHWITWRRRRTAANYMLRKAGEHMLYLFFGQHITEPTFARQSSCFDK